MVFPHELDARLRADAREIPDRPVGRRGGIPNAVGQSRHHRAHAVDRGHGFGKIPNSRQIERGPQRRSALHAVDHDDGSVRQSVMRHRELGWSMLPDDGFPIEVPTKPYGVHRDRPGLVGEDRGQCIPRHPRVPVHVGRAPEPNHSVRESGHRLIHQNSHVTSHVGAYESAIPHSHVIRVQFSAPDPVAREKFVAAQRANGQPGVFESHNGIVARPDGRRWTGPGRIHMVCG